MPESTVVLILLVLAFALLVLRAFGLTHPRFEITAAGLALWVLAVILGGAKLP